VTAFLYCGDAIQVLQTLPEKSVQCCVTSPPYWGLRDYGIHGQLGLESTPEEYVAKMVNVFGEVRRVLRDDGTLWLNLGDSYTANERGKSSTMGSRSETFHGQSKTFHPDKPFKLDHGLKPKDLVGIPWRVAFALQADGWYLRSDIIWSKPNPMPESVTDRPTKAHEYVFLLSKSQRYFYDHKASLELADLSRVGQKQGRWGNAKKEPRANAMGRDPSGNELAGVDVVGGTHRNPRTVWDIATQPYAGAHFATMPAELASRCIKAGSKSMDTVLDPFGGSGTTASVATGLGRNAIHIDLNPEYIQLAEDRIGPMLCERAA